jgi:SWI/SNF-related matrix-associated actin-dependent regulator 1 of chromatin subfamily A
MKRVECWDDKTLILRFSGSDFESSLSLVRSLPGREWVNSRHYWTAPARRPVFDSLIADGWELSPAAQSAYNNILAYKRPEIPRAVINVTRLPHHFPFQIRGVEFLEANHGRGIIGDEMGLGKTIQALGYFIVHPELRPVVVVCPASLKINWTREIQKWTGESSVIISGRREDELPQAPWYVINYDVLGRDERTAEDRKKNKRKNVHGWWECLVALKPAAVVGDEVHYLSDTASIRSNAFRKLVRESGVVTLIMLSGTPARNRPRDLFTALNLIAPLEFRNWHEYCEAYCGPRDVVMYWRPKIKGRWPVVRDYSGASNLEELNTRLIPYMIRRTKAEVLPDLPPKTRSVVYMELDEPSFRAYAGAAAEFMSWVSGHIQRGIEEQKQLERLKQLAYLAKRNAVIQWIKDFLDVDDKLVVFAYHTQAVHDLRDQFPDISVVVEGATTMKDRQAAVDRFQTDMTCRLFIGEILAAGEGWTLTAAHAAAVVELVWVPTVHEQAEDRLHRIGQKDNVLIYYLIARDTVEDTIMDVLQSKFSTLRTVLDNRKGDLFFNPKSEDDITASVVDGLFSRDERKVSRGMAG